MLDHTGQLSTSIALGRGDCGERDRLESDGEKRDDSEGTDWVGGGRWLRSKGEMSGSSRIGAPAESMVALRAGRAGRGGRVGLTGGYVCDATSGAGRALLPLLSERGATTGKLAISCSRSFTGVIGA